MPKLPLSYNPIQDVVDFFYSLKGWDGQDKNFYKKNNIRYERYVSPAKDLLILCDNDVDKCKDYLQKIRNWAVSLSIDWSIETVARRWLDLENNIIK